MREHEHRVASALLANERTVWIREPRDPGKAAALTVFLDGEIYRDHMDTVAQLDRLDAKGETVPSWHVFVTNASEASRWLECPCYPPFARFVLEELMPWLERSYPAIKAVDRRVLVGLSYTGLAATYVALQAEGFFHKVVSQSGSYWSNDGWLIEQFRQRSQRLPTDFLLEVGRKEIAENVQHKEDVMQVMSQLESVRRFRDLLRSRGYTVEYVEFDGSHHTDEWKKTLPHALRWALDSRICPPPQRNGIS